MRQGAGDCGRRRGHRRAPGRSAGEPSRRRSARNTACACCRSPADITVEADLERIIARTVAELGEIDILINNAGIAPTGRAERISRDTWHSALELDLTAPMFLSQKVAQRLIERRKPGRIINITSVLGEGASAVYRLSPYVAAKAGLANLTRQLAVEWAPYGINVNAISPGWIPTEATEGGMSKGGNKEKMESLTPLGTAGRARRDSRRGDFSGQPRRQLRDRVGGRG